MNKFVFQNQPLNSSLVGDIMHSNDAENPQLNSSSIWINDLNIVCKVEFYQPSCWLYSVSNLFVF